MANLRRLFGLRPLRPFQRIARKEVAELLPLGWSPTTRHLVEGTVLEVSLERWAAAGLPLLEAGTSVPTLVPLGNPLRPRNGAFPMVANLRVPEDLLIRFQVLAREQGLTLPAVIFGAAILGAERAAVDDAPGRVRPNQ